MVSEKMGLPFYRRRRRRRRRGGGPVHNTNFLEKWLFSIIYFEKFLGFVYHSDFRKSLYFYIVDAEKKKKKKKKKKTSCVWVLALY